MHSTSKQRSITTRHLPSEEGIFGEVHPDDAKSYVILGSLYYFLAQYNQAKECLEKPLIIQRKLYGEEHADVATT